jgi:hypothetical protein
MRNQERRIRQRRQRDRYEDTNILKAVIAGHEALMHEAVSGLRACGEYGLATRIERAYTGIHGMD